MGSGSSTYNNHQRTESHGSDVENRRLRDKEKQSSTISREHEQQQQTLPFLQNASTQHTDNNMDSESRAASKMTKERFQRVLGMVRKESKTLNSFNAKAFDMRKRELATIVSDSVQRERREAEEQLVLQLSENGVSLGEDLAEGRNLLFSMIGYELSSSEDEGDEEEHDINRPVTTDSMLSECRMAHRQSRRRSRDHDQNSLPSHSKSRSRCNSPTNNSSRLASCSVSRSNSKATDDGPDDMPRNRFDYSVFEDNDQSTHRLTVRSNESCTVGRNGSREEEEEEEEDENSVSGFEDFEVEMAREERRAGDGVASDEEEDQEETENYNIYEGGDSGDDDDDDDESEISDITAKDDDFRPTAHPLGRGLLHDEGDGYHYTPRRSSVLRNERLAREKTREHKLHSIMRQESLEERQARAKLQLEKRKLLAEEEKMKRNGRHDSGVAVSEASNRAQESTSTHTGLDDDTFEARKNVKKEFKAYDALRKESVAGRQSKQRAALARRLELRRQELGLGEDRGRDGQQ